MQYEYIMPPTSLQKLIFLNSFYDKYPHLTKCRTENAGHWDSAKTSYSPPPSPNNNNF